MALNVWTQSSGYSLGTLTERVKSSVNLPVTQTGVTYSLIAGKLPAGLHLEQETQLTPARIAGVPYEVPTVVESTFVIRATKNSEIADRTFKLSIEGADTPIFVTQAGQLDIGNAHQYYTLDSSFIDFQIEAYDEDLSTGQKLTYFIADGEGQLPPGLMLTPDGRIVGFVQPLLSLTPEDGDGKYDNGVYDSVAYDFAFKPTNGYDSYVYDTVTFDFSIPQTRPKKINLNYEFKVSISDGTTIVKRIFKIFVVGDDYFRADNTNWLNDNSLFTADVTYLRGPIWLTAPDLGTFRANNYLTLILDTYDTDGVQYSLVDATDLWQINYNYKKNDLIKVPIPGSTSNAYYSYICIEDHYSDIEFNSVYWDFYGLPPGTSIDTASGEIYGAVPYQPAISKIYQFTIRAIRYGPKGDDAYTDRTFKLNLIGEIDSTITWVTPSNLGTINANFVSTLSISATSTVPAAVVLFKLKSGTLPPGLSLSLDGEIVGKVRQFSTVGGKYKSIWRTSVSGKMRSYSLDDIVKYNGVFYKALISHTVPVNGTFDSIKWDTFTFADTSGMLLLDGNDFTLDNRATSFDTTFNFVATARDQYGYSASDKKFTITVDKPNTLSYSNIKTRPFLKATQRSIWREFINNTSIFPPTSVYRPNDISFGTPVDLSMLIYAGLETRKAATYISAMGLNHKRKRFNFGEVKKAVAYIPGTKTPVYEVVYVQMIDPLEINGKKLPNKIKSKSIDPKTITVDKSNDIWTGGYDDTTPLSDIAKKNKEIFERPGQDLSRPDYSITVDSQGFNSSNPNINEYFINSVSNWRNNFKTWSAKDPDDDTKTLMFDRERLYLPLWMRSIQAGSKQELDFQLAVPLCYCKPGTADTILLNIKNYVKTTSFNFNLLDYTVDRYIIDSVKGSTGDKYLVFKNDRITV